jgi:hypothetical protein
MPVISAAFGLYLGALAKKVAKSVLSAITLAEALFIVAGEPVDHGVQLLHCAAFLLHFGHVVRVHAREGHAVDAFVVGSGFHSLKDGIHTPHSWRKCTLF